MTDKDSDTATRQDWAEERTDWAEDRTLLANERTFAGWMRTGMTALAVAIGLQAVFGELQPTWAAKATATAFIIAAILIFAAAAQRSHTAQRRIESHDSAAQPAWRMTVLAVILSLGSVATGIVLWMI
jgi:putative membrane protein